MEKLLSNGFISAVLILALTSGCSWTRTDTYRHAALTGLMAIDMMQTLKIADKPDKYHEHNPILGRHPDRQEVLTYFGISYATITAATFVTPKEYRPWLQYVVIGVETAAVGNNVAIGLGIGF